jgi:hypothetical protein
MRKSARTWLIVFAVVLAVRPADAEPTVEASTLLADFANSSRTLAGMYYSVDGARPDVLRDSITECGTPPRMAWRIDALPNAPEKVTAYIGVGAGQRVEAAVSSIKPDLIGLDLVGSIGSRHLIVTLRTDADTYFTLGTIAADQLSTNEWKTFSWNLDPAVKSLSQVSMYVHLEGSGPAWFALDRLTSTPGQELAFKAPTPVENKPATLPKALWVWETRQILANAAEDEGVLDVCRRYNVKDLFWQIAYGYDEATSAVSLEGVESQQRFNTKAHAAGVRVHALDGHPEYVRAANHGRMLSLVDAIARFNAASQPEARFVGVHLDNEPYVLPDWKDDAQRVQIIRDYVALNRAVHARCAKSEMVFGVDIPFWWDEQLPKGPMRFTVDVDGQSRPLLNELFTMVDNVGVMSYRERAIGHNGVAATCSNEFRLGAEHKVPVWASIELGNNERVETGTTLGIYGMNYVHAQLATLDRVLRTEPGCGGVAIHCYEHLRDLERKP